MLFGVLLVAGGIAMFAAAAANAQELPGNQNQTATPEPGERIEPGVRLVEYSYSADSDMATLIFDIDQSTALTLTDAGEFWEGGELTNQRTEALEPGRHKITMPATEIQGAVGIQVSTQQTRYSVVIRQFEITRPPVDYGRVQILVLLTAVGAAGMTLGVIRRRYQEEEKEAERLL